MNVFNVGRLMLRIVIGGIFIAHGTQKLFGWFGGSGLEGTGTMMESLDMQPKRANAIAAGATEAGGGALILTGLGTPLAATGLIAVMLTAIRTAHWQKGFWNYAGGWEYNAVQIAALAALAGAGAGPVSLDAALGTERRGSRYALGALAIGAAGSTVTIALARREAKRVVAEQGAPEPGPESTGEAS
jgi:putative oxidoreductase